MTVDLLADSALAPTLPVRLTSRAARAEHRADGTVLITSTIALEPYPETLIHKLEYWAAEDPDRVFLTEADGRGGRRVLTFGQTLAGARSVAEAFCRLGLTAETPLAMLAENSLNSALMIFGALYAGVPAAPISPGYALLATDFNKLSGVLASLGPGAIFVSDGERYGQAVRETCADIPVISAGAPVAGRETIALADLLATPPGAAAKAARAALTGATVAKILFTSGSVGLPKPVIIPHRMLAVNRQQVAQQFAFLQDEPALLVDWLPWHHTFGGNNNIGLALWSGGQLHIDTGRPSPEGIKDTVELIRQFPPNFYINTPAAFDALVNPLREDADFRAKFFSRVKLLHYGGAVLSPQTWKAFDDLAVAETGHRILLVSGVGSTECGPVPMQSTWEQHRKPEAGLPVPGVVAKLVPAQGTWELRMKGPCITPGYWRRPDLTAAAFDEEGFFRLGDAVRPLDPDDFAKGLVFDGRIAENFKLSSGVWVQVANVRQGLLAALAPVVRDVVIAGHNRDFVTAIGFPELKGAAQIAGTDPVMGIEAAIRSPRLRAWISERLAKLAQSAGGASVRVARLVLEGEAPSFDNGELTDKGSASARLVLTRRASAVDELYSEPPSERVLTAS